MTAANFFVFFLFYLESTIAQPFPSFLVSQFQNESKCENDLNLHENEPVGGTHLHLDLFCYRGKRKL